MTARDDDLDGPPDEAQARRRRRTLDRTRHSGFAPPPAHDVTYDDEPEAADVVPTGASFQLPPGSAGCCVGMSVESIVASAAHNAASRAYRESIEREPAEHTPCAPDEEP